MEQKSRNAGELPSGGGLWGSPHSGSPGSQTPSKSPNSQVSSAPLSISILFPGFLKWPGLQSVKHSPAVAEAAGFLGGTAFKHCMGLAGISVRLMNSPSSEVNVVWCSVSSLFCTAALLVWFKCCCDWYWSSCAVLSDAEEMPRRWTHCNNCFISHHQYI